MPSELPRTFRVPTDASAGVQQTFRDLNRIADRAHFELDLVLGASGEDTSALAPTNIPTGTTKTIVTNEDGSMDVILTWAYTQGALKAELFALIWKEGAAPLSALTVADNSLGVGADARAFRFEGLNPNNNYRFGIAAGRRPTATSGVVVGTIVQPDAGGGSWADLTFGTPNYIGNIMGVEQHNWALTAAGAIAGAGLVGQIGLTRDGTLETWSAADPAYNGVVGFQYGLSYNLLIHDLAAKQTLYAHCYDLVNFGAAVVDADLIEAVVTGTGVAVANAIGKFGRGISQTGVNSTNRGFFRTRAASANYKGLVHAELWFKRSGNPAGIGDILALGTTNAAEAAEFPILRLNTNGTITVFAWDGVGFDSVTSTATVTDDNYHYIQARIFGTTIAVYIDGAETTAVTNATSFDTGNGSNLFVLIGTGGFDVEGAACFYDELVLSTVDHWRTVPTKELDDRWDIGGSPASGTISIWHFQEVSSTLHFCNARKAPRALANVVNGYNLLAIATGDSLRYLFALHASNDPKPGRTVDGVPLALASIGGNRLLFESGQFRTQSAYLLVGQPLLGEGNGIELYAGQTNGATDAVAKSAFQTQGSKILSLSGTGWQLTETPGVPTNNPASLALTNSTIATGNRTHKLTWTYTQPALSGDNKPADGLILYYQATNTSDPAEQQLKMDPANGAITFEWSLAAGAVVSYAIASYRKTSSGVEVGAKQTTASWQNVAADKTVDTAGITDNNVTAPKLPVTLTINPSQTGATAIFVDNAGKIRMKSISGTPSEIVFEDSGGTEQAQISGDAFGLRLVPENDGVLDLEIGIPGNPPLLSWGAIYVIGTSVNMDVSGTITLDGNNIMLGLPTGFGGGVGVIGVRNAGTNPSSNPSNGGILYATGGGGTWRGSGGTVTTFGPAGPHCGECGYDFWLVCAVNAQWGAELRICAWCGKEYRKGPHNVLALLSSEQRQEIVQ